MTRVYRDVFTGDVVLSNAFTIDREACVFRVPGTLLLFGESGAQGTGDSEEGEAQLLDVACAFGLRESPLDRKAFLRHVKDYIKRLATKLEATNRSRLVAFELEALEFAKRTCSEFEEYQVFFGRSGSSEGMPILCKWSDDGSKSTLYYFADGLVEELQQPS